MEEMRKHFRVLKSLAMSGKLTEAEMQAVEFIASYLSDGNDPELVQIWYDHNTFELCEPGSRS